MVCILTLHLRSAWAVGEPVNGFPSWAERVIHEWINRARVDPQFEMSACGAACVERDCYGVMPPLTWSEALNRAARFHSDEMVRQGYFAHDSACTLVSNINALYPTSCNGAASCACVGGTKTCSTMCSDFAKRVQLFGGSPSGEIIASPSNPNQAFYLWLFETGDVTTCRFTGANGHRWLILKSTGAVGAGVAGYSTGDFGAGSAPTKIPSGAHYPQQAASVAAWANWYDSAGPSQASVNVDGTCTAMTLQRGSATNGAWSATLTGFGSGCHRYYFSFRDAAGNAVTYPTTGSLAIGSGAACPDWDSARPAACAVGTATATPSFTPIPATPTASATASRTPSATATASRSATPSATATASASPSPRPSSTPSGRDVRGSVRYYSNAQPLPQLSVRASGATASQASTDAAGQYALTNVPIANLLISPDGAGYPGGAVSPLDAAWVLQAVANTRTLSARQALACDVTGNGSLSTLDASLLLQYSVGLIARLPVATTCDSDWAFIPVPAAAPGQTLIQPQPGTAACTPGGIAFQTLSASVEAQDFAALAFGDCTGNWQPPALTGGLRAQRPITQRHASLRALRGGRLALPIALDAATPAYALEARIAYDPAALRMVSARLLGAARHATLAFNDRQAGLARLAVASVKPIAAGRSVAVVLFEATRPGRIAAPSVSIRVDD